MLEATVPSPSMIVETDIRYRAMIRLQGERSTKLRVVSEPVPLEIEQHSRAEVVCRWNAPRLHAFGGETEAHVSEVLAVGGSFFRIESDDAVGSTRALRAALEARGVFATPAMDDYALMEEAHRPTEVVDLARAIATAIEPYDRRLRVGKVQERVGRYAVIGGRLCSRRSEPVLVAGIEGGGLPGKAHMERIGRSVGRPTVTAAWSEDVNDGSKGRGVFRLDRLQDAIAYAASYAARSTEEVRVMAQFEIVAPETLRLDDEIFAMAASARQAFRHLSSHLSDLPRPVVDAAFDLRDMLAAPDLRLDFLRDAFERVCDNLRPLVGDPNVECDRHTLRNVLEELDEAHDRLAAARPEVHSEPRFVAP